MTVTLKDIAQKADRSVITVSRALAGHSDVAESTRQRVRQTAEEMGYYPNIAARHLQKQRTGTLAFVIPTHGPRFSDPFFSKLLAGIGNEAGQHHFDLLVSTQPPDSEDDVRRPREAREPAAETHVVLPPQLIVREPSGPHIHSA
jgi:LacI family transcriptional regulator